MTISRFSWLAIAILATGCRASQVARADEAESTPITAGRSAVQASPDEVLKEVFVGLVYSNPKHAGAPDSLFACPPDFAPERNLVLATFRVLSVDVHADSALGAVQVTSVAEQIAAKHAADRFDGRMGVRTDTLHQRLVRTPGGWKICGHPDEVVGFIRSGDDEITDWSPAGANWNRVSRLADSVRETQSTSGDSPPARRD